MSSETFLTLRRAFTQNKKALLYQTNIMQSPTNISLVSSADLPYLLLQYGDPLKGMRERLRTLSAWTLVKPLMPFPTAFFWGNWLLMAGIGALG